MKHEDIKVRRFDEAVFGCLWAKSGESDCTISTYAYIYILYLFTYIYILYSLFLCFQFFQMVTANFVPHFFSKFNRSCIFSGFSMWSPQVSCLFLGGSKNAFET